jgi:hypothetical protein
MVENEDCVVSQVKVADNQSIASPAHWRVSGMAVTALTLLLLGLWNLVGPAMWWDEGWTGRAQLGRGRALRAAAE